MDFREFVRVSQHAGRLSCVDEEIDCADIPSRVAEEQRRRNRALIFNRVTGANARVVGNLFGSAGRICQALSARNYSQLFRRFDASIAQPAVLRRCAFPVEGYVRTYQPDLTRALPLITYSRDDATPYLTSGIILAKHPVAGRHHVCYVRMSIVGGDRLLINPATQRIKQIIDATVGQGQELDVAILIGAPTEIVLMACTSVPEGIDKLEVAQAMAGEGLIFSDELLPVPLSTEYILKCRVVPTYEREGPVGDQKGLYSVKERSPLCLVDELRSRNGSLFHSISGGVSNEHVELITLGPRAVLERLKRETPAILRYDLPGFTAGRLAVLVIKEGFDPRSLMDRLGSISSVRGFVAINRDVSSRSASDLLWAVVERAKDSERFNFFGPTRDGLRGGKFLINATVDDLGNWNHRRIDVYPPGPQTMKS